MAQRLFIDPWGSVTTNSGYRRPLEAVDIDATTVPGKIFLRFSIPADATAKQAVWCIDTTGSVITRRWGYIAWSERTTATIGTDINKSVEVTNE